MAEGVGPRLIMQTVAPHALQSLSLMRADSASIAPERAFVAPGYQAVREIPTLAAGQACWVRIDLPLALPQDHWWVLHTGKGTRIQAWYAFDISATWQYVLTGSQAVMSDGHCHPDALPSNSFRLFIPGQAHMLYLLIAYEGQDGYSVAPEPLLEPWDDWQQRMQRQRNWSLWCQGMIWALVMSFALLWGITRQGLWAAFSAFMAVAGLTVMLRDQTLIALPYPAQAAIPSYARILSAQAMTLLFARFCFMLWPWASAQHDHPLRTYLLFRSLYALLLLGIGVSGYLPALHLCLVGSVLLDSFFFWHLAQKLRHALPYSTGFFLTWATRCWPIGLWLLTLHDLGWYESMALISIQILLVSLGLWGAAGSAIGLHRHWLAEQAAWQARILDSQHTHHHQQRQQQSAQRQIDEQLAYLRQQDHQATGLKTTLARVTARRQRLEQRLQAEAVSLQQLRTRLLSPVQEGFLEGQWIFDRPRSEGSGDFYWFGQYKDKRVIVLGDLACQGATALHLIVQIRQWLDEQVHQQAQTRPVRLLQGLDTWLRMQGHTMAVLILTIEDMAMQYQVAGAKMSLLHLRPPAMHQYQGRRRPAGHASKRLTQPFEAHTHRFAFGDLLYLSTDGFRRQLGGADERPYSRARWLQFAQNLSTLPLSKQPDVLAEELEDWKGEKKQTDDMLIIGLQL